MTLLDAVAKALDAYDEDEAEREAILDKLAPILLGDSYLLSGAIGRAWEQGHADEIRAAISEYQIERAEIDAQAAADDESEAQS